METRASNDATPPVNVAKACGWREKSGKKESDGCGARFSNLPNYAVTGVKAQAFVRALF